jgi:uncharacterized protein YecE (DUF72 family)
MKKNNKFTKTVATPIELEVGDLHRQSLSQPNDSGSNISVSKKEKKYVVVRDHKRVSDLEYDTDSDPTALIELEHWQKIIKEWPDGTKAEIVEFDNKKHRIW